jgi:RNA polymerase subunit RPABC4/transcription elongation factor Spt4
MLALIVFGMNNELERIGPVNFPCPNCNYTPTNLAWSHRKATVYFIPLFGMGKSYALTCDHCGLQTEIDQQLGEELHRSLSEPAPEAAFAAASAAPRYTPLSPHSIPTGQPTTVLSPPASGTQQAPGAFGTAAPAADNERTQHLGRDAFARPPGAGAPGPGAGPAPAATCARCGSAVPTGAKFCQVCGAAVGPPAARAGRACANCGYVQSAGQFCNNCGSPLA